MFSKRLFRIYDVPRQMVDAMGLHCRNSTGVSEQSIGHDSCHQGFYNLDGLVICKFMEK